MDGIRKQPAELAVTETEIPAQLKVDLISVVAEKVSGSPFAIVEGEKSYQVNGFFGSRAKTEEVFLTLMLEPSVIIEIFDIDELDQRRATVYIIDTQTIYRLQANQSSEGEIHSSDSEGIVSKTEIMPGLLQLGDHELTGIQFTAHFIEKELTSFVAVTQEEAAELLEAVKSL